MSIGGQHRATSSQQSMHSATSCSSGHVVSSEDCAGVMDGLGVSHRLLIARAYRRHARVLSGNGSGYGDPEVLDDILRTIVRDKADARESIRRVTRGARVDRHVVIEAGV